MAAGELGIRMYHDALPIHSSRDEQLIEKHRLALALRTSSAVSDPNAHRTGISVGVSCL